MAIKSNISVVEMSRFDAVIFDMDGVIVDSEPIHEMLFLEIWNKMGYGETHGIHFQDFYGQSDRAVWQAFIKKHQPAQSIGDLTRLKEDRLIQLLRDKQPIFDGVPNLVRQLAKQLPLAVASGSVHRIIDEVLAMRDLRRYFRCTASSEDVEKPKPAPDTFLLAARRLGVMPKKCCVIEDTVSGVLAGKAAGMTVLAITNTFKANALEQAGADQVFQTYEDIGGFFEIS
ncbi:HAD family phosphatase [bacterium]|nr:HAD family phosphatase [bacterium]